MLWILGIIVFIILGTLFTQKEDSFPSTNKKNRQVDDFSEEEIEYDYLQRQQEEQDEEDYYLQHRRKEEDEENYYLQHRREEREEQDEEDCY